MISRRDDKTGRIKSVHGFYVNPQYKREYYVWKSMLHRCENPNAAAYASYGGRGIVVCERWHNFLNFYEDMGPRPSKSHSVGRKDNDGNYCPTNCRWEDFSQQAANTRNNVFISHGGKSQHLAAWARELGIPEMIFRYRIRKGFSIPEIASHYKSKLKYKLWNKRSPRRTSQV